MIAIDQSLQVPSIEMGMDDSDISSYPPFPVYSENFLMVLFKLSLFMLEIKVMVNSLIN